MSAPNSKAVQAGMASLRGDWAKVVVKRHVCGGHPGVCAEDCPTEKTLPDSEAISRVLKAATPYIREALLAPVWAVVRQAEKEYFSPPRFIRDLRAMLEDLDGAAVSHDAAVQADVLTSVRDEITTTNYEDMVMAGMQVTPETMPLVIIGTRIEDARTRAATKVSVYDEERATEDDLTGTHPMTVAVVPSPVQVVDDALDEMLTSDRWKAFIAREHLHAVRGLLAWADRLEADGGVGVFLATEVRSNVDPAVLAAYQAKPGPTHAVDKD